MKALLLSLLLGILLIGIIPDPAYSQTKQTPRSTAASGDSVGVIVNYVKADKRMQFERFLHEIFWPGATKLSKEEQKVFRQTRILQPTAAEPDGTYAYFFIMDPVIPKGNYDIENLLTRMFGETTGKEHLKLFTDALANEGKSYIEIQSRH
ncbi:hypothetical protein [Adhaeribacter pallidiroseus]|uniref:Uncharacterized protein n=1 Tax=Adhaeribacter pallidiroseus TaxID=2072847 RepID=A0A369QJ46_9BACT|nr:hypothetical protein [Adhaeribacter pallidiroseus]RDC64422.1 hypothetical protein AHMF7616_03036 [Adhaeribacter pallidiroseus]